MAEQKYAFQNFNKELMARAVGRDLAISTKQAIEICNFLRHRKLEQAKRLLEAVMQKKQAVPFKRFTNGPGHKPGKMASGRYPMNSSRAILKLLESAEANAQTKGLSTGQLEIIHICAHQAHRPMHYGRHHGREFKRTHVEVVLQEAAGTKKEQKKEKAKTADTKEQAPAKPKAAEKKSPEPKKSAQPNQEDKK